MPDNPPRQQYFLSRSEHFITRVKEALSREAWVVLNEAGSVANHAARFNFARQVVADLDGYAKQIALTLVERPNLIDTASGVTSFDYEIGDHVTSATQGAIEAQIEADWNRMSGVSA